jgi:hypothetical protein
MAVMGLAMAGFAGYWAWAMKEADEGFFPREMNPVEEDDDANIYGKVLDTGDDPLENVSVSVEGEDIEDLTDENGVFALYNVPYGAHKLIISKEGYRTIEYKLLVEGDITFEDGDNDDDNYNDNDGPRRHDNGDYELIFRMDEGTGPPVEEGSYPNFVVLSNMCMVCAAVMAMLSIVMLASAIYSYRRKKFLFCMVGAIIGIILVLPLGIIAMILLMLSSEDFNGEESKGTAK